MVTNGTNSTMTQNMTNTDELDQSTTTEKSLNKDYVMKSTLKIEEVLSVPDNIDYGDESSDIDRPGTWKLYGQMKGHGKNQKFYQTPIVVTYRHYYNANATSNIQNNTTNI